VKLSRTRNFMLLSTISDYAWYYLYHAPRYALDKRYRKSLEDFEDMLRKAHAQAKRDSERKASE